MEWFTSLLSVQCAFCGVRLEHGLDRACPRCAIEMADLEQSPLVLKAFGGPTGSALPVAAAGLYQGWYRELILEQKRMLRPLVVRWLAELLSGKLSPLEKKVSIAWVPGGLFQDLHLVEALALELARLGHALIFKPELSRAHAFGAPQKLLTLKQRQARQHENRFLARGYSKPGQTENVFLLDDVATTGTTLLSARRALEAGARFRVVKAITLAYTPAWREVRSAGPLEAAPEPPVPGARS